MRPPSPSRSVLAGPGFLTGVALTCLWFISPEPVTAQVVGVPVEASQAEEHPYRFTGLIRTRVGSSYGGGSGVLAVHPKFVFSVAHVVSNKRGSHADEVRFFLKHTSDEEPPFSSGTLLNHPISPVSLSAAWVHRDAFAADVREDNTNEIYNNRPTDATERNYAGSVLAMDRVDFVLFYGYPNISTTWAPAEVQRAASLLSQPTTLKLYTGYPARLDGIDGERLTWRMHQTGPVSGPFSRRSPSTLISKSSNQFTPDRAVKIFGGNSGGPVWVRESEGAYWLAGLVTRQSGKTFPLSDRVAQIAIQAARKIVGSVDYPTEPDTPVGRPVIDVAPGQTWSGTYGLGEVENDIDTFTLRVPETGDYEISTTGPLDTVGNIATRVPIAGDDNSGEGKNFRIGARLTKNNYVITVRGAYPGLKGTYSLHVKRWDGGGVKSLAVIGAGRKQWLPHDAPAASATAALGNDFGTVPTNSSPRPERVFRLWSRGGAPLGFVQSPTVEIVGPHADQFEIVEVDTTDFIAPGTFANLRVRYNPTAGSSATHFATIRVHTDDDRNRPFVFGIRGRTGALFTALTGNVGSNLVSAHQFTDWEAEELFTFPGELEYGGDIDLYRFTVTERALWIISTTGNVDTHGTLYAVTGGTRLRRLAVSDNVGADLNFAIVRVLNPGDYAVAVRGARVHDLGSYVLRLERGSLDASAVVLGPTKVPIFDGQINVNRVFGNDFGTVDHRKGTTRRTFLLVNQGYSPLQLTGTPKILISGPDAAAFRVLQPKAAAVAPGRSIPFMVLFDPARPGLHEATISIPIEGDSSIGGAYDFHIAGEGTGPALPVPVKFAQVATRGNTTYALDENGKVWAWGYNFEGQVGNGTVSSLINRPTRVQGLDAITIVQLAAGHYHVLALDSDGDVWSWGANDHPVVDADTGEVSFGELAGMLGHGDTNDRSSPVKVAALDAVNVKRVAAGVEHSLCVDSLGRTWGWGANREGQLGLSGEESRLSPTILPGLSSVEVTNVVAGNWHSFALDVSGKLMAMDGFLLHTFPGDPIVELAAGFNTSFARDAAGRVWSWGFGGNGLGRPGNQWIYTPALISGLGGIFATGVTAADGFAAILDAEGEVWAFGAEWNDNAYGVLGPAGTKSMTPIHLSALPVRMTNLSCGYHYAVAIDSNGQLWTWGFNGWGQLGYGTNDNSPHPTPQRVIVTP
jgi:alpha-tubulin suppressor-like RCC1 family protein